jgi:hemerythrin-like metal-binding protein
MEAFVWDDRYLTGHATIDAQHRRLFDLANRIGFMLVAPEGAGNAAIDGVFHELAEYAERHFKEEEELMRSAGISAAHCEHHAASHRDFAAQLSAMWVQRTVMKAPAETLHGFLVAWLAYHILGEDQAMTRLLLRQRDGMDPTAAQALEPTRGERSSSALLQALRRLYGVLSGLNRELVEAHRLLEDKVAERTASLAEANRKLTVEQAELIELLSKIEEVQRQLLQSEKMASIGQLAAGVAHEINNPIGFVNSNLGSLERYIADLLRLAELGAATPAGQAYMDEIDYDYLKTDVGDLLRESREGLERVRRIVANLKDFSRVEEVEWQDADLLAGLESTLNVAWHELKFKADIVRELQPLPLVRCVPAQINQVFLNLLVNAAQAIAGRGTITLRSGTAGKHVWLEVEDSGCGMDETTRRRMFEPFFTTKPVGSGTGLGLSLAYDIIINKHAGRIDVDSHPGQGTTIRLWLPIAGPATSA